MHVAFGEYQNVSTDKNTDGFRDFDSFERFVSHKVTEFQIRIFSGCYLIVNTLRLHYKTQLVNVVYGNNRPLF